MLLASTVVGSFCVTRFGRRRPAYEPFGDTLTPEQVRDASVWRFDKSPKTVVEPHDYAGGPELFLDAKPLGRDVPELQRRKRVDAWCELLPTLTDLRRLWLFSHVPKRLFEAACELASLEALYVKWGDANDLSPLSALPNLRHVHLGSLTKVTDLRPLAGMKQLRSLEIENFKGVEVFDGLAGLTGWSYSASTDRSGQSRGLNLSTRLVGCRPAIVQHDQCAPEIEVIRTTS